MQAWSVDVGLRQASLVQPAFLNEDGPGDGTGFDRDRWVDVAAPYAVLSISSGRAAVHLKIYTYTRGKSGRKTKHGLCTGPDGTVEAKSIYHLAEGAAVPHEVGTAMSSRNYTQEGQ